MQLRNDALRYGAISQTLHWATVVLVIVLVITGKFGDIEATRPNNATYYWHSSLGILVYGLAVCSILWNAINRPPRLRKGVSRISSLLARTVQISLYVLLLALPVSGLYASSAEGASVEFFGFSSSIHWQVPTWLAMPGPNKAGSVSTEEARGSAEELHEALANVLLVLASLHVLAALKHHFLDRDDTLLRMLPWRRNFDSTTREP